MRLNCFGAGMYFLLVINSLAIEYILIHHICIGVHYSIFFYTFFLIEVKFFVVVFLCGSRAKYFYYPIRASKATSFVNFRHIENNTNIRLNNSYYIFIIPFFFHKPNIKRGRKCFTTCPDKKKGVFVNLTQMICSGGG